MKISTKFEVGMTSPPMA